MNSLIFFDLYSNSLVFIQNIEISINVLSNSLIARDIARYMIQSSTYNLIYWHFPMHNPIRWYALNIPWLQHIKIFPRYSNIFQCILQFIDIEIEHIEMFPDILSNSLIFVQYYRYSFLFNDICSRYINILRYFSPIL